ncbi:MAG: PleD family two-component system response regulator [Gemmatimonadales bacterium]
MSQLKILIADDDTVARKFLLAGLNRMGHECVVAVDGKQAWEAYQESQPSVILADWLMPGLSGLELCRMIRADRRERYTYVILVTALSGKGCYLEGMDAGADDFVTKPFDLDEMGARLRVAQRIINLQTEIHQLHGLLPTCSYCRRIRDQQDTWSTLESYLAQRTELVLSHSICPECYHSKIAPEINRLGIANLPAPEGP